MSKFQGRLFTLLWLFWLVCALFFWAYWLASVPVFLQRAATGALPTAQIAGLTSVDLAVTGAASWGVTVATWSHINVVILGLSFLIFSVVGGLIWWRVRTAFGLLTAYVLLVGGSAAMSMAVYSAELSVPATAVWELGAFIWPLFFVWLFLFPNGRAVPRRLLWVMVPLLGLFVAFFVLDTTAGFLGEAATLSRLAALLEPFGDGLIIVLIVLVLAAQIYRYVRVSGSAEREQTKWFLFGLLISFVPLSLLDLVIDYPAELDALAFTALPIGIGISILRYRLWDIDVIIRRTLIYGLATAVLVGVYFGVVLLAQSAFVSLTGQESPLAIVISTLVIAALFNPLRRSLQSFIDRRFYRRKYDAEQILARFAQTAREETDLEALVERLTAVVAETMQPEATTVWIKK